MAKKVASAKNSKKKRESWLDKKDTPVIEAYARQAKTFLRATADGRIEESELKEQEERLVKLMKEVEPELDDELHEKVTRLLCETTVYDLMQTLHAFQQSRPKSQFKG